MWSESWCWKNVKQRWKTWQKNMKKLMIQIINFEIIIQLSTRLQFELQTRKNLLKFKYEADSSSAFNFDCDQNRASAVNKNSKKTVIKKRWNFSEHTYLVLKMILYLISEFLELESEYKMLIFIFLLLYNKVIIVIFDIMKLYLLVAQ